MQDHAGSTAKERVWQVAARVVGWLCRLVEAVAHRGRGSRVRRLQMIESLELGNRRQLFLIACDDQPFLVGAGSDRVGTLVAVPLRAMEPDALIAGLAATHPSRVSPSFPQRSHLRQPSHAGGAHRLQLVKDMAESQAVRGPSGLETRKRLWP